MPLSFSFREVNFAGEKPISTVNHLAQIADPVADARAVEISPAIQAGTPTRRLLNVSKALDKEDMQAAATPIHRAVQRLGDNGNRLELRL
jgi:hypothetical protein